MSDISEVLFEAAIKNSKIKILIHNILHLFHLKKEKLNRFSSTFYFNTFEKTKVYFKLTHQKGPVPKKFGFKIFQFEIVGLKDFEMYNPREYSIEFKNCPIVLSDCMEFRFPLPGVYFITFQMFDEKGYQSDMNIIAKQRTFSGEFGPAKSSSRNFSLIPIIVLDYFAKKVEALTSWLVFLTLLLIALTIFVFIIGEHRGQVSILNLSK